MNLDVCSLRVGRDDGLVKSCRFGRCFVVGDVDGAKTFGSVEMPEGVLIVDLL